MESLWVLIPLSAALVLLILGVFGWAVHRGQFEDLEAEGERILTDEGGRLDSDQGVPEAPQEQFPRSKETGQARRV
jgi:cbb3-type cytochrome oxidase maturation protein